MEEIENKPNQVTAANAGRARLLQSKRPWPGIAEFSRWCDMHAIIPFLSVLGVGFGCCLTLCAAVPRFRPRAISRDPVTVLVALSLVSISLGLAGLGVARSYTKPLALVSFGAGCIASTFHHETRALWKDFLKTGKGKLLLVPPVIIGAARAWFKR